MTKGSTREERSRDDSGQTDPSRSVGRRQKVGVGAHERVDQLHRRGSSFAPVRDTSGALDHVNGEVRRGLGPGVENGHALLPQGVG